MSSGDGAIHVASIKAKRGERVYWTHLLRRTYRHEGKVKHLTLGNISHLPPHIIDMVKCALRGEAYIPAVEAFDVVRNLPHGHVAAILGTMRQLDVENLLAYRPSRERGLVAALIVSRIIDPCSKLATSRGLNEQTMFTSLGETLGLGAVDEEDFYEAMDWLAGRQLQIEAKLAKRHLSDGCLVLYDVTSTYYTGKKCALAEFGYNRDRKKGFPQIQFGLLCSREGCPVAVEVFEGNLGDPATLRAQIDKVRKRFGLKRVILVGDRGLITDARIREELKPVEGLDWISALRGPAIRQLVETGAFQLSLFDERDLAEITSDEYPNERLIVCRNQLLAEERSRKRQALLEATEKELDKIVAATRRTKRPLVGKEKIGLRVGQILNRHKVGKHFTLHIDDEEFSYQRDTQRVAAEAALDGIYVIRTSVSAEKLTAQETVEAYKGLSRVEQAFRSLKAIDLKVRPIYHRLTDRVRAHVFLCMLAYYVEWHMRRRLAPILFDDEKPAEGKALRNSVVSPAKRSPSADLKTRQKQTTDGYPVHSFQTLLTDLATICVNRIRPVTPPSAIPGPPLEFNVLTIPTPLQRHAFDLLGVPLSV